MNREALEALVGKLTKAQRHWLPTFSEDWFGGYAIGMSKATMTRLIDAALVEVQRPAHFGIIKYRLTPLGLAVRDHLRSLTKEDGR